MCGEKRPAVVPDGIPVKLSLVMCCLLLSALLFFSGPVPVKASAGTGGLAGNAQPHGGAVAAAVPYVTAISPGSAPVGAEVTVAGSGFGPNQGNSYVSFGSEAAVQYGSWSELSIVCVVPAGIYGRVTVTVTTDEGTSEGCPFLVQPKIESVDPDAAPKGTKIAITGSGFEPERGDGFVLFDSTRATEYVLWSDTRIEVKVPVNVSGNLMVRVFSPSGGESPPADFEVVPFTVGFAEGYTGPGFQEFLCIGNAQPYPTGVVIVFLFPDGSYLDERLTVPANSRATVDVNTAVGPGEDVSAIVFSDLEVVVERPMYFNYNRRWTGGHDVIGTPYVSKLWFFAEGYTGPGFEEWICVLNPSESPANLTFHFQVQGAGELKRYASVPPLSRGSFKVNDLLGSNHQCSLALESSQYVVAERSMYFDYLGGNNRHWEGGHCVMGVPYLSTEFYFAEGTTREGFEEWITIQNPDSEAITVIATYQMGEGQGGTVQVSHVVPPQGRETVYVPDDVGKGKDVSVKLASSSYFLAERPMYFRYTGYGASWEGGHCVIGAVEAASEWFFAEGYTGYGFHEWLCLQNPSDEESSVEVSYLGNGGAIAVKTVSVPARSRKTLLVNEHAGPNLELSCRLRVLSGPPVVAERPMYFIFRGWDGGHDVVGYYPLDLEEEGASGLSGLSVAGLGQKAWLRDLPLRHLRGRGE